MGKYKNLINNLFVGGKLQEANYAALMKSDHGSTNALISNLLGHKDPDVRETCAEILSEKMTTKAIPSLISALLDENLFVRQDALWAIEKISGYDPGKLQEQLKIGSIDSPQKLYNKVSLWWQSNRKLIEKF